MSKHANMATGAPSSSRKSIRGAGATYRASIQKQSRNSSSTKSAGSNERPGDASVNGASRTTEMIKVAKQPAGYGSGVYTPSK